MARIALVVGVLAVLALPAPAGSGPLRQAAVGIDSITPPAGVSGASVTIVGNGFGGPNVRITVGGIAAKVVSATGGRATFVVPVGAPLGTTRVRMTNPGGQSASIDFGVRFDGNVAPVADGPRAAAATIGPGGGSVSAGGMTLSVPRGALSDEQTITMTPLASLGGSPLGSLVGGVELEPRGLHFLVPASLTIPLGAGVDTKDLVGFGFDGGGTSFHLTPRALSGGVLTLRISHFSGAGAGTLTPLQTAATLSYLPTPADELAQQQIAAAVLAFQQTGADPGPAIDAALDQWYHSLRTGLQSVGNTVEFFELAAGEWMAWLGYVQQFGRDAQHAVQNAEATDLATTDGARLAELALAACDGTGSDPYAVLTAVNRIAADLLTVSDSSAVAIETQKASDGRQLPAADDLDRACVHVSMDTPSYPAAFTGDSPSNTITTHVRLVFWNAVLSTLPVHVNLYDITSGASPPPPQGGTITTDGNVTLQFKPSSSGHRFYLLVADVPGLPGGGGGSTIGEFDAAATFDVDVRHRFELHSNATIAPGDTVTLTALVAGDGMSGASVGFSAGGPGTLSATSGTTDANGAAPVDYTASSDPAGGTDTVVATFVDGAQTFSPSVQITVSACTPHPVRSLARAGSNQCTAAVTIDAYTVAVSGTTFAQCIGHLGTDDHEFTDTPPPATGRGPFSSALTASPTQAVTSCSAGTGSDSTAGSVAVNGAIDQVNDVLTVNGSSHGTTTAQTAFTGDPHLDSCLDVGDGVFSSGDITFTIANAMSYELTGSFTETRVRGSYSLTRIAPTFAPIVDRSQGGAIPAVSGTLAAGTYEFRFRDVASNDLACQVSGTVTDSFAYSLQLIVHD